MKEFIIELKTRNEVLFYFGAVCFLLSLLFITLTNLTSKEVMGVNAWFKPFKFALSIALHSWTMAWFIAYLPSFNQTIYQWSVVGLFGFEIVYIALQAAGGQLSHYNVRTPVYRALYMSMALAATALTLYTAYIGLLFFRYPFPDLPIYYLCGIRLGIWVFVVFSLEGFAMGSRLSHTVGGADGSIGLPLVNWSLTYGDLRIAHFIGMHALQVIPFISFYILKSTRLTIAAGVLYAMLATFTLLVALKGKPLFKMAQSKTHAVIS